MSYINNIIGTYSVPFFLSLAGLLVLIGDKELFSEFLKGAREGALTCFDILPSTVILITAVGMFTASGALEGLIGIVEKPLELIGIPPEILPVVIMRPLSGSAANAAVKQLFDTAHPDNFAGRCVSVIMGSSDTIVYTLAMYFGAVGVRKTRHALPAAVLTMVFCTLLSSWLTVLFFGK